MRSRDRISPPPRGRQRRPRPASIDPLPLGLRQLRSAPLTPTRRPLLSLRWPRALVNSDRTPDPQISCRPDAGTTPLPIAPCEPDTARRSFGNGHASFEYRSGHSARRGSRRGRKSDRPPGAHLPRAPFLPVHSNLVRASAALFLDPHHILPRYLTAAPGTRLRCGAG